MNLWGVRPILPPILEGTRLKEFLPQTQLWLPAYRVYIT